ncbi:helix-turn-helix domain-containing protein [Streptomyces virginiae]|uniref:helix-turn-helix domain-containing protein n=1 Tax=Streptomyces virginiae TaxID=1961 RepID=UPI0036BCF334
MSTPTRRRGAGRRRNELDEGGLSQEHLGWLRPLRAAIDRKGVTNDAIASKVYVSKGSLSKTLNGRTVPDQERVYAILDAIEAPPRLRRTVIKNYLAAALVTAATIIGAVMGVRATPAVAPKTCHPSPICGQSNTPPPRLVLPMSTTQAITNRETQLFDGFSNGSQPVTSPISQGTRLEVECVDGAPNTKHGYVHVVGAPQAMPETLLLPGAVPNDAWVLKDDVQLMRCPIGE